ncbi:ADP/ATP carrier protein [Coemansia sp. RSA 989]|nr:ADP/ATP carrier protein [Coemansia sp. RSA 989]
MSEGQANQSRIKDYAVSAISGGISSHISTLVGAPLDRVKLILQAQKASSQIQTPYKGVINVFTRLPKEQGFFSLWRGNMATILRFYPVHFLNFTLKDKFKALVPKYNPNTDYGKFVASNLFIGGLAGLFTLYVVYPLDLARTRMALDVGSTRQFTGLWNCMSTIYKSGGISSLYYGYTPAALSILVYRGLYFGLYDSAKQIVLKEEKTNFFKLWLVAQATTLSATVLSYPLDTVRRHLCMQAGSVEAMYTGTIDCFQKLHASGGIRAFYGGASIAFLNPFIGAPLLVFYDHFRKSRANSRKSNE